MKNENWYWQYPTIRNPYKKIVIPDLKAFKEKLARLESLSQTPVTNAFSYSMEAAAMRVILELYNKQEEL